MASKKETILDKARQARFPQLSAGKQVVDVAPLAEDIDLQLWSDGSVTWTHHNKPEEGEKDGD